MNVIRNGELTRKYNDPNGKDGPWYGILAFITWNHASEQARYYLPRAKFAPAGQDDEAYHETQYPTWDWGTVVETIVNDIIGEHFMEWYYDYCQPRLEKGKERLGKFFQALDMTLDYTTHLVEAKMKVLLNLYYSNPLDNNYTHKALNALACHRDRETIRMSMRFNLHDWNHERYDPAHEDNML
jgi:hypothetical protein